VLAVSALVIANLGLVGSAVSVRRRAAVVIALHWRPSALGGAAPTSTPRCPVRRRTCAWRSSPSPCPSAAYVPCISELPTGWSFEGLDVDDDGATISLESDRADRPVEIALASSCDVSDATPITPSDEGVRARTTGSTRSTPGTPASFLDVFPGGCVVDYDFERGPTRRPRDR
jgi:hypothetical protein